MAIYKTSELFNRISELINDGYEYTDVSLLEEDEDFSECLHFDAIVSDCENMDYEEVDSCKLPECYSTENSKRIVKANDFCATFPLTYKEIFTLSIAIDNALEYFKECIDKPENKSDRPIIKQVAVDCRNLQAKFKKFSKYFDPR